MKQESLFRACAPISVVASVSAAARLGAASSFVAQYPPGTELLVVGASRQAADDFVREIAARTHATFGIHRLSLLQLAALVAAPDLARRGLAPASVLGVEAVAARAAFEARRDASLAYLAPIADQPGFPAALASTIVDLRAACVDRERLPGLDACVADIADLAGRVERQLDAACIADLPLLLAAAAAAIEEGRAPSPVGAPVVLLDVPVDTASTERFVSALLQRSAAALVTVPGGDQGTTARVEALPGADVRLLPPWGDGAVSAVQRRLFSLDLPADPPEPGADPARDVQVFSAPGEGREAVEIARRALHEARRGTPFDRMAVFVRAPQVYGGLLETAFRRAGVPAWFSRGTSRPDPSGRAFLTVLACALERLSARRFAEYLSLAQVPDLPKRSDSDAPASGPAPTAPWVPPGDDLLLAPAAADGLTGELAGDETAASPASPGEQDDDQRPVLAGSLRVPWHWEKLLVDAAVIGGRDRWRRRLDGLAGDLRLRLEAVDAEDPDSPRARALARDLANLEHLARFALPLVDRLAALPREATWGTWLEHLDALAPVVLRRPEKVLTVLAELRPMSDVGPVTLDEVRRVLASHLSQLHEEPPPHRYGAVFVGTPDQARGRQFEIVFVPGLAERLFPQRAREDPLLLDHRRKRLSAGLRVREDVTEQERVLLRLAVGAATRRLYLSYPRMELAQARARVFSFYALDLDRARTGRIPDIEALARQAEEAGGARLAWPAPADPDVAVDDGERDLAVLGRLLRQTDRAAARGRARFLLGLNQHLARALRARWARAQRRWSAADGLVAPGPAARAALDGHRLRARPYSASALQRFGACPYQFLLGGILRLEPREEADWLEELDPLTRGQLFHRVQAEVTRGLAGADLAREAANPAAAMAALDAALDRVAREYSERLAPAIDRVWRSEIDSLRTDLRGWLQRLLDASADWVPLHAELGFGFGPADGLDPASTPTPVTLEQGWRLHGMIDLVERQPNGTRLRVTDHKTGRARTEEGVVVGGGEALQPVLYGLALERVMGRAVDAGRLFYCTLAGGYAERVVTLNDAARRAANEVLEIVDRAVEQGTLVPAPREKACDYCDFRPVCGPDEARRIARKDRRVLADLEYLRGLK